MVLRLREITMQHLSCVEHPRIIPFRQCVSVYTSKIILMMKVNISTSLGYHLKVPPRHPPRHQHRHLALIQGTLHHALLLVHQDPPHLADGQVLSAQHQHPAKHFLGDVLAGERVQKGGVEQRIFGHSLKLRMIIIVVGFAYVRRKQGSLSHSTSMLEKVQILFAAISSVITVMHGSRRVMNSKSRFQRRMPEKQCGRIARRILAQASQRIRQRQILVVIESFLGSHSLMQ
ncbi:uncharacterized protein EV420DRAFT_114382 [Desarmillaria tabescens]|uniref:Uncharacterized protein n=1 Tax=Armillaria tabescens TaxID=1929756 RepID=A0AA39NRD5_ARMTA|nr:uncharacterized protein EV420DRAFT_114382 [Desarmillaria tabescens]KAK0470425.1 hypothetical protein EV420DRAFT_114382 [Desarmillaria tabescens]